MQRPVAEQIGILLTALESSLAEDELASIALRELGELVYHLQNQNLQLLREIEVVRSQSEEQVERERAQSRRDHEELTSIFRRFLATSREDTFKELSSLHHAGIRLYSRPEDLPADDPPPDGPGPPALQEDPGEGPEADAKAGSTDPALTGEPALLEARLQRARKRSSVLQGNIAALQHYNSQLWAELKLSRTALDHTRTRLQEERSKVVESDTARKALQQMGSIISTGLAGREATMARAKDAIAAISRLEEGMERFASDVRQDLRDVDAELEALGSRVASGWVPSNAAYSAPITPVKFRALDDTSALPSAAATPGAAGWHQGQNQGLERVDEREPPPGQAQAQAQAHHRPASAASRSQLIASRASHHEHRQGEPEQDAPIANGNGRDPRLSNEPSQPRSESESHPQSARSRRDVAAGPPAAASGSAARGGAPPDSSAAGYRANPMRTKSPERLTSAVARVLEAGDPTRLDLARYLLRSARGMTAGTLTGMNGRISDQRDYPRPLSSGTRGLSTVLAASNPNVSIPGVPQWAVSPQYATLGIRPGSAYHDNQRPSTAPARGPHGQSAGRIPTEPYYEGEYPAPAETDDRGPGQHGSAARNSSPKRHGSPGKSPTKSGKSKKGSSGRSSARASSARSPPKAKPYIMKAWVRKRDLGTGAMYWYNSETGVSRWTSPFI